MAHPESTDTATRSEPRRLGEYDVSPAEAAEDPQFTVHELPADLVDEHLTKTFTPGRYAKLCRDVAYFSRRVGSAPEKSTGGNVASPGSGLRRSNEGALYGLAHREPFLSRAVDLGFIRFTNEEGMDAPQGEWRFALEDRGRWFLTQFYGDHVPVRKVRTVKLSRYSAAKNLTKTVIGASEAGSAKPHEEYAEQVEGLHSSIEDVSDGNYLISADPVKAPATDPDGAELVKWVDHSNAPVQFDTTSIDGEVEVRCYLADLAAHFEDDYTVHSVRICPATDGDGLVIEGPTDRQAIRVAEQVSGRVAIEGEFEAFVESGAKDALKQATEADYDSDYRRWLVDAEAFLRGAEAMLDADGVDCISAPTHVVHQFTEYL